MGCCSTEIGPKKLNFTLLYAIFFGGALALHLLGPHASAYSESVDLEVE
jgi:hypothetical protein